MKWELLCGSLNILWHCPFLGLEWKLTFSSTVATAEFSKFENWYKESYGISNSPYSWTRMAPVWSTGTWGGWREHPCQGKEGRKWWREIGYNWELIKSYIKKNRSQYSHCWRRELQIRKCSFFWLIGSFSWSPCGLLHRTVGVSSRYNDCLPPE